MSRLDVLIRLMGWSIRHLMRWLVTTAVEVYCEKYRL